jgi:hypothetical protein
MSLNFKAESLAWVVQTFPVGASREQLRGRGPFLLEHLTICTVSTDLVSISTGSAYKLLSDTQINHVRLPDAKVKEIRLALAIGPLADNRAPSFYIIPSPSE